MKVAAVVLAAGASTRLGESKQQVRLGGETLLQRTVRVAQLAGLDPVFVVVAPGMEAEAGGSVQTLINPEAAEGMAASVRVGIAAAAEAQVTGVVVLACDQPAVTPQHLRELARGLGEAVASEYAGRKGVPAYLPAALFPELMKLHGDAGARGLLRSARAITLENGELDIDTAEDLARARQVFPGG